MVSFHEDLASTFMVIKRDPIPHSRHIGVNLHDTARLVTTFQCTKHSLAIFRMHGHDVDSWFNADWVTKWSNQFRPIRRSRLTDRLQTRDGKRHDLVHPAGGQVSLLSVQYNSRRPGSDESFPSTSTEWMARMRKCNYLFVLRNLHWMCWLASYLLGRHYNQQTLLVWHRHNGHADAPNNDNWFLIKLSVI